MICVGLAAFLLAAQPSEGHRVATVRDWVWALSIRGVVIVLLVVLSRTGSPARRAALLGCAAGLVWAIDAAFVKSATDLISKSGWTALLVHWQLYAVVATGVLGTLLLQAAFAAGPLAASQPAILIVDPLASIALGIELFGERLNTSAAAITVSVIGLLVMAVGVVMISAWAPPVMRAANASWSSASTRRHGRCDVNATPRAASDENGNPALRIKRWWRPPAGSLG